MRARGKSDDFRGFLVHPSPYGHGEMGGKIAQKMREEFKIL